MPRRNDSGGPSGFLPVRKPSGITSFDVIRELRRSIGIRKLGHSGVLDRPASGVLVVGANKATRLFELFGRFEKEYTAEIWLGLSTATDDLTGELIQALGAPEVPREQLEAALARYRGEFSQMPPAFSLAKKAGKELYRYALAGQEVEVEPRTVAISVSTLTEFEPGVAPQHALDSPDSGAAEGKLSADVDALQPLTRIVVDLTCTGGLYVRSLARDIGAELGCGGALGRLVRTRVGPFTLEQSRSLEEIAAHMESGGTVAELLLPLAAIAPPNAVVNLDATQLALVRSGQNIRRLRAQMPPAAERRGDMVFGLADDAELAAVLTVAGETPQGLVELKPTKVVS